MSWILLSLFKMEKNTKVLIYTMSCCVLFITINWWYGTRSSKENYQTRIYQIVNSKKDLLEPS